MAKKPPECVCNIAAVRIDRGDHHEVFARGQPLVNVPESMLEGMLRVGSAVCADDFLADPVAESAESPEPVPHPASAADWKQFQVVDLDLPEGVVSDLIDAKLETVFGILEFAAANDGLTSIDGIGEATEKKIQEAIAKVAPQE